MDFVVYWMLIIFVSSSPPPLDQALPKQGRPRRRKKHSLPVDLLSVDPKPLTSGSGANTRFSGHSRLPPNTPPTGAIPTTTPRGTKSKKGCASLWTSWNAPSPRAPTSPTPTCRLASRPYNSIPSRSQHQLVVCRRGDLPCPSLSDALHRRGRRPRSRGACVVCSDDRNSPGLEELRHYNTPFKRSQVFGLVSYSCTVDRRREVREDCWLASCAT